MKKTLFIAMFMVAIVASTSVLLISSGKIDLLSKLSVDNIEALADNEEYDWLDSHSMDKVRVKLADGYWWNPSSPWADPLWMPPQYGEVDCCVETNQSSKCNQAMNHSKCP